MSFSFVSFALPWKHLACLVLLASAVGCQSASKAAHETAIVTTPTYASVMAIGQGAISMIPLVDDSPKGPADIKKRMEEKAGPAHFQNDQLLDSRDRLRTRPPQFSKMRHALTNETFTSNRAQLLEGGEAPFLGSLTKYLGLPSVFRTDKRELSEAPDADVTRRVLPE